MARQRFRVYYFSLNQHISDVDIESLAKLREEIIFCDLDAAYSEFHILAALEEAVAAKKRGGKYRNLDALFMMYLTGRKQIKDAIKVAGIKLESKKFFAVCLAKGIETMPQIAIFRKSTMIDMPIPRNDEKRDEDACWQMTRLSLNL